MGHGDGDEAEGSGPGVRRPHGCRRYGRTPGKRERGARATTVAVTRVPTSLRAPPEHGPSLGPFGSNGAGRPTTSILGTRAVDGGRPGAGAPGADAVGDPAKGRRRGGGRTCVASSRTSAAGTPPRWWWTGCAGSSTAGTTRRGSWSRTAAAPCTRSSARGSCACWRRPSWGAALGRRRPGPHPLGDPRAPERRQRPPAPQRGRAPGGHPQRHHRELPRAPRRAAGARARLPLRDRLRGPRAPDRGGVRGRPGGGRPRGARGRCAAPTPSSRCTRASDASWRRARPARW
jgi:hypothetical protein